MPPTPTRGARTTVQRFLGARSSNEIVFVRGATEAINLVAGSWGRANIGAGDEIIVSLLEHHANIVPWKRLADEAGATLKVIPVDDRGQLLLAEYAQLLTPKTKLVAGRRCRMRWAPSRPRARSCAWRMRSARGCWSTARSPCCTCLRT